MFVCARGLAGRRPIVPSTERVNPGVETQGSHAWPVVCALGRCCVTNERGFCAAEAEGELLRGVCAMR